MQTAGRTAISPRGNLRLPRSIRRLGSFVTWLAIISGILLVVYNFLVWPWLSRWGATNVEVERVLPGDELVANPMIVTTKAVTVQATPAQIWPWLVQLGVDRGGMYSYLWVENWLLRLNVSNSDTLNPAWQDLQVGDFIRFTPKEYRLNPGPGLYVLRFEPEHVLAGCFGMEDTPVDCAHGSTWQFVLEPESEHSTRLILRSRSPGTPTTAALFATKFGGAFQFFMERKMLLTLKAHAEADAVALPLRQ